MQDRIFVIGAPKCGTTSLYDIFAESMQHFTARVKETHFFSSDIRPAQFSDGYLKTIVTDDDVLSHPNQKFSNAHILQEKTYTSLFAGAAEKIPVDISNSYFYSNNALREIRARYPKPAFLLLLRNPVARALSHYMMEVRLGLRSLDLECDFERAKRTEQHWGQDGFWLWASRYELHAHKLADLDPESLLVETFETCKPTPSRDEALCQFVGLPPGTFLARRSNKGGQPRFSVLDNILARSRAGKISPGFAKKLYKRVLWKPYVPELSQHTQHHLHEFFAPSIECFRTLTKCR